MDLRIKLLVVLSLMTILVYGHDVSFSTAGFYELKNSGREVYNMNIGWRFYKGSCQDAWKKDYDDMSWERVSLPHGLELLPEEASGCINYQGEAWYRKYFSVSSSLKGKKIFLHFEGIMGKSTVWINGHQLKEHYDGYTPVVVEVTDMLSFEEDNIVAVCTDNSDDPSYLPGKPQQALDFTYFGGIYRDCFLIAHDQVYITDANYENEVAGGGIFVHYPEVSAEHAEVGVKVHIRNTSVNTFRGNVNLILWNSAGKEVSRVISPVFLRTNKAGYVNVSLQVNNPELWFPDSPVLHKLEIRIEDKTGKIVDGMNQRIGIRKIEYRGEEGLYLNGQPYKDKLIGVNRHQDFAVIGNALPNSLHWRDAKKLRDAGIRVIRCAHYPHDPAFLDACDYFGMLVVLPIAGWQFWNTNPVFEQRIYTHIRQLVRRDRNHASIFIWEPVLNETRFPKTYAKNAKELVDKEYPYAQALSACDPGSLGNEYYPVIFTHPIPASGARKTEYTVGEIDRRTMYFTREFGDNVDDWNSHNSNSRVHRSWGEVPMLQQAVHYASPDYPYTCLESLYASDKSHVGGTLWHAFDHQRGYHPQPFYGGIMDAFRQPKTSYYMFMSQRPAVKNARLDAQTGPMVYVANEMTPFSPSDVTLYSNCEEVRLTVYGGGKQYVYRRASVDSRMPSPIIVFKDVYHFMDLKKLSRAGKQNEVYLLAEGLIGGKVVASHKRTPSRRPVALKLRVDDDGLSLKADGSDVVTVIAEVVDKDGVVKRLSNTSVKFTVSGEAELLGDDATGRNPVIVQWGSAPALIRATATSGAVRIKAEILGEGVHAIAPAELVYYSTKPTERFIYNASELDNKLIPPSGATSIGMNGELRTLEKEILELKKKLSEYELREVEEQQDSFGEQR
ncbi:glycoside hydrolase family 2 protein [Bacteroides nordii]|uniref:glycoside hydrolase family 2 protein n=1 Tax=Bacteroides nordii TaxID=291645 RepID=UPI003522DE4D